MLTEKEFLYELIDSYKKKTDRDMDDSSLGNYLRAIIECSGADYSKSALSRKQAARIVHEFMLHVMEIPDVDWGGATKLKDIYECRVCANSIAQVYVKGIIPPLSEDVFGLNENVSEAETKEMIDRLLKLV